MASDFCHPKEHREVYTYLFVWSPGRHGCGAFVSAFIAGKCRDLNVHTVFAENRLCVHHLLKQFLLMLWEHETMFSWSSGSRQSRAIAAGKVCLGWEMEDLRICFCNMFHLPFKSVLGYFILLLLSRNSDLFKGLGSLKWASCVSRLPTVAWWPLCLCKGRDPKRLYSALWLHLLESCLIFILITLCVSLTLLTLSKGLNITEQMCQDCLRCSLLLQHTTEELSLTLCT